MNTEMLLNNYWLFFLVYGEKRLLWRPNRRQV